MWPTFVGFLSAQALKRHRQRLYQGRARALSGIILSPTTSEREVTPHSAADFNDPSHYARLPFDRTLASMTATYVNHDYLNQSLEHVMLWGHSDWIRKS